MKIRLLTALVVLVFVFLGWYMLKNENDKSDEEYMKYISLAREQVKLGINEKALENYKTALGLKESHELRIEILDFLIDVNASKSIEKELVDLKERYPKDPTTYEYLCRNAVESGNIADLYSYSKQMESRGVQSEIVKQLCEDHKYDYYLSINGLYKIDPYAYGYARLYSDNGKVGFVDSYGNVTVNTVYQLAAPYSGIGSFIVKDKSDQTIFIDMKGIKTHVDPKQRNMNFDDLQGYYEKQMAVCENGLYRYINYDYEDVSSDEKFLYAGMFNCGRSAVQTAEGWYLIDSSHKKISNVYDEIKLTENGFSVIGNLAVVKRGELWYLVDLNGNLKFDQGYDDMCFPLENNGDGGIAVKKNDKWGFVDPQGNVIIDFLYDNARSFCRGVAAVEVDGVWGIIDKTGKYIIDPEFKMAYELTGAGSLPVETKKGWQFVFFYSMK